jgi:DNA-binding NtrC family response regulator
VDRIRGVTYLRQHSARLQELPNDTRAHVLLHIARDYVDAGDESSARPLLRAAYELTADASHAALRSQVLTVETRAALNRSDFAAARQKALECVSAAKATADPTVLADSLLVLGNTLNVSRELVAARGAYAKAALHYRRASDPYGRVLTTISRAGTLLLLGDLRRSRRMYEWATRAAGRLGRRASLLRANLGLGSTLAKRGAFPEARALLLGAWREARRTRATREEALALEHLAECYLLAEGEKKWLAKARAAIGRGKSVCQRIAPTGDIAIGIVAKEAVLFCADGSLDAALRSAASALRSARQIGLRLEEAQALRVLGSLLVRDRRREEARAAFVESRSILQDLGERLECAVVEEWIESISQPHRGASPRRTQARRKRLEGLDHWINHTILGPGARVESETQQTARVIRPGSGDQRAPYTHLVRPPLHVSHVPLLHPSWAELGLLTRTPELIETLSMAETYSPENIPILVLGETGTGKDLLAQGIHELSGHTGRYVPVNCAAAQRELFAAELFGARRGAYTGAIEHRHGLIREAEGGTLFFDEIADLNREAQGYLLRFLDSGEVRPIGDSKSAHVETRLVAATCRDLGALAAQGHFRHDLRARLAAVVLTIPPLRRRTEDLDLLLEMLWQRRGGLSHEFKSIFTPGVLATLATHPWPGNVRELAHLVARILPIARSGSPAAKPTIQALLGRAGRGWEGGSDSLLPEQWQSSHRILREDPGSRWTRAALLKALDEAGGHVPTAARILGLSRSQAYRLYRKLRAQG